MDLGSLHITSLLFLLTRKPPLPVTDHLQSLDKLPQNALSARYGIYPAARKLQ